jgi:hydroxyacylglutathione hydrolase
MEKRGMIPTIQAYILGPFQNNSYLVGDPATHLAALVDPSFGVGVVLAGLTQQGWQLTAIWLTHAHFDHTAGVVEVLPHLCAPGNIALHPLDLALWQQGGAAQTFGFPAVELPPSNQALAHRQVLQLGEMTVEVRHAPGHTPGHVVFYLPAAQTLLDGDVLFYHGVGRTDLPGADSAQLASSIREQVYSLPPDTRVLSGHGPQTTVGEEMRHNPFVPG